VKLLPDLPGWPSVADPVGLAGPGRDCGCGRVLVGVTTGAVEAGALDVGAFEDEEGVRSKVIGEGPIEAVIPDLPRLVTSASGVAARW
jgi:hypothetical protein